MMNLPHVPEALTNTIMTSGTISTVSPTSGRVILTREECSDAALQALLTTAAHAFKTFSRTSLAERQKIVGAALDLMDKRKDELAHELTRQMGRPIAYADKEIITAVARGRYMLKISEAALKDTEGEPEQGFKRYVRKMPLGPVLVIFAWNVSAPRTPCCPAMSGQAVDAPSVPLPHPSQLALPCSPRRQQRHHQAFTANTHSRRADRASLRRGRPAP